MKFSTKITVFLVIVTLMAIFDQFYFTWAQPSISAHIAVSQLNGGDTESASVKSIHEINNFVAWLELVGIIVLFLFLFFGDIVRLFKKVKDELNEDF